MIIKTTQITQRQPNKQNKTKTARYGEESNQGKHGQKELESNKIRKLGADENIVKIQTTYGERKGQ